MSAWDVDPKCECWWTTEHIGGGLWMPSAEQNPECPVHFEVRGDVGRIYEAFEKAERRNDNRYFLLAFQHHDSMDFPNGERYEAEMIGSTPVYTSKLVPPGQVYAMAEGIFLADLS